MAETKVEATLTEKQGGPRNIEVNYDFGDSLQDAVDKFGEDVVFESFKAHAKINLQALLRRAMAPDKEGNVKSDAEIHQMVSEWKPGVSQVTRKSSLEKAQDQVEKLSPDEVKKLLESLRAKASEGAKPGEKVG